MSCEGAGVGFCTESSGSLFYVGTAKCIVSRYTEVGKFYSVGPDKYTKIRQDINNKW